MSLVEQINKLSINSIKVDENFKKLKDALDEYHSLVQTGKLIPRQNNIQDIYTIYSFNSNVNTKL